MKSLLLFGTAVLLAFPALADDIVKDPAQVEPGLYKIEPEHTRLLFSVLHFGFTPYYGEIENVSGTLDLKPQNLDESALDVTASTGSITTKSAKLAQFLKTDKWLDATKYPQITFKATKLVRIDADDAEMTGNLTLHGVTQPVTLKAKFIGAGINPASKLYTVGFEATGKIKRSDFGVKTFLPAIGDEVDLIISAAFEKKT